MLKSISISAGVLACCAVAFLILPLPADRVAAQSAGMFVNAVDLDIVPAERENFIAAIKENGAATAKEPACRRFDILNLASDPNHFFLYEVYDNEAALRRTARPSTSRNIRPRPAKWSPSARRGRCR